MSPIGLTCLFLAALGSHLLAEPSIHHHARSALDSRGGTAIQSNDSQAESGPVARFAFDGTVENSTSTPIDGVIGGLVSYVEGLEGQALSLGSDDLPAFVTIDRASLPLDTGHDFSVQVHR